MRSARAIRWMLVCLASACAADPNPISVSIANDALVGCRSPAEPGCEICREEVDYGCVQRSFSGYDGYNGEHWYNVTAGVDGACGDDAARCARCSEREEAGLRLLAADVRCDCDDVLIGIDPCQEHSCACFCSVLLPLIDDCMAEQ